MPLPFIIDGLAAPTATTTNWGTTLADDIVATSTAATTAAKVAAAVGGGLAAVTVAYALGKQSGVEEGYHDGYTRASEEYEKKFASQVRLFEEKETLLKDDIARYRKLCEDLSAECNRLKNLIENDVRYKYLYMKAASDYILLVQLAMSRGY